MPDTSAALPHFWPLIDALPVAVMYKEHGHSRISANKAAIALLNLPANQSVFTLNTFQQLTVLCPQSGNQFDLLHNPLLRALSGIELECSLQFEHLASANYKLQSTFVLLPFTLHSTTLVTIQREENTQPTAQQPLPQGRSDIAMLEEALAFDKLISVISTELINVHDDELDMHMAEALAAIGEFCHADRSYVFQFNNDITEMSNTHEWVRAGISAHQDQLQHIPQQALPYFFAKIQQDFVFAVDVVANLPAEAAAEKAEFDAEDIQSVLCSAMLADDKIIGFVGCDMVSRQRNWTSNDLRRLKLVGEMLANALQNLRYRQSLQQIKLQLEQANAALQQQAHHDGLTGIANRRYFDNQLQQELYRCRRFEMPFSLLMLDIDYFKAYNDLYGHQAGDEALQHVASILQKQVKRQGELAARYGGEEFAIILPGSDHNDSHILAENIQFQLKKLGLPHQHSPVQPTLTLSIGYCSWLVTTDSNPQQLIKHADEALYQAKKAGRNTIYRFQH
jgi:diguanylate cyclase (GGDEF)-like protein